MHGGGDVVGAYDAFARAAAAHETAIVPLVEMSKIVAGARATLGSGAVSAAIEPLPSDDTALLRAPLTASRPNMAAVESALADEIVRRLEVFPVPAESVYALDRLSECVSAKVGVCVVLADKLARWYVVALKNPRINPQDRAFLNMSEGRFLATRGETERAVAGMVEAARIEPRNLAYSLGLAILHMDLGQWHEAAEVLAGLESRRSWSGFGNRQIHRLRERYENRPGAGSAVRQ